MKWYAIFVKSGKEEDIQKYLTSILIDKFSIDCKVIVPKRELMEYREGIKTKVHRLLFPGYVFLGIQAICAAYYIIKERWHSDIYRFLRDGSRFQEIQYHEIEMILKLMDSEGLIGTSEVFVEKEKVLIMAGPLTHYTGIVVKINARKGRAKIQLNFLNNNCLIDIGINDLKRIGKNDVKKVIEF